MNVELSSLFELVEASAVRSSARAMSGPWPWPAQRGVPPPPKPGDTGLEREREERGALQRFNFDSKPAAAQGRAVTPTTVNIVNIFHQAANFISSGIKPSQYTH